MAFDTEPSSLLADAKAGSKALAGRARGFWQSLGCSLGEIGTRGVELLRSQPIVRYFSASLKRRIMLSNLIGLVILLGGYLYMNQYKDWLVDSKVDSLTAQGEIIAQAIAANAKLDGQRITIDPDAFPDGPASLAPFRDDAFAKLSFNLGPERIAPVLRRLIQPHVRARVFDRGGKLIVDSGDFFAKGEIGLRRDRIGAKEKPKTKNLWTRMTEYLFTRDLPVLKELDQANGNYYPPVRAAMAGTGSPMLLLNSEGQQIVSYAAPIRRARQVHGVLLLSTEPGEIEEVLNKERNAIISLAVLALAAAIAVSLLLAYSVAGPIRRLSAAAEAVSQDINAYHTLPIFPHRADEVAQLSEAFAAMTASLQRRLEASEKFAADVAHELKNPLTAARSTAESLAYARTPEQRDQLVDQIQMELKRLNRLITDVSNASRLDAELALQQREPVDLSAVLTGVAATFQDILQGDPRDIALKADEALAPGLVVNAHEGRMAQVLTNLIDNAISFSPQGGTIFIRAQRTAADMIEIEIEDEGSGIEPDKLETIFKRFYTYRPTGESSRGNNSGLGLSITREIVRAHGGTISAANRQRPGAGPDDPPIGARFTVRLPAAVTGPPQRTMSKTVRRA